MKEYIVEFNKQLNNEQKLEILRSIGAEYKGNIFMNFESVVCNEDVAVKLKQNDNIMSVEGNGTCEPQDVESADFPTRFINVLGNAHEKGYKGDGVAVAVIDSGINYEHEDLQFPIYKCARILGSDIISVDNLEDIKDTNGHGTAVASIVAMQDNELGYLGVSPNVKMMIVKGTDAAVGSGSMSYASMAKAVTWAVDNGADIINVSYSQSVINSAVRSACEYAYLNNVSVVASAGNGANDLPATGVNFWKDYPGVLVVGSVTTRNHYQDKQLPELPTEYYHYKYKSIYHTGSRYRLLLSDSPINIDPPNTSERKFIIKLQGYNAIYDYYPETSNEWVVFRQRNSGAYTIGFSSELTSDYPLFTHSSHDIVNNRDGGVVHKEKISLSAHNSYVYNMYGGFLIAYNEGLNNVIKAPFSAIGDGIDFVAPGYFNFPEEDVNNIYRYGGGTSYSAPFVAGIIALLRQRFPDVTVDRIYDLLNSFAVTVDDGNPNYYGNGLVTMPDLSKNFISKFYYKCTENEIKNIFTV